jgi:hypothetical protein
LGHAQRRSALKPLEVAAVIFITGVVVTVLYSAYRTHRVRGEVSEGVALAATIAPLLADRFRHADGISPELSAAIPSAFHKTLAGSLIESVAVVDGRIDVVFSEAADSAISGRRISLTPYETADMSVVWLCGNELPGPGLEPLGFARGGPQAVQIPSTIEPRYLTTDCR